MALAGAIIKASDINNAGMAWINGTGTTAASGAIGATETVILTLPSFTYKANVAYSMIVSGGVSVSVANNTPLFRFRKTNTSGQVFDQWREPVIAAATSQRLSYLTYFVVGAADVTAVIVLTATGSGAYNVTMQASATTPATLNVFRAGDASAYPNSVALV